MTTYIALLRKDDASDYGVNFPDFPGCVTAAPTLEGARALAAEALGFHIEGMLEDRERIPAPSTLDAVMAERDHQDAVAFLVDVPVAPARSVRVNVMLPEEVVQAIDRVTNNRSRFLAEAARSKLAAI